MRCQVYEPLVPGKPNSGIRSITKLCDDPILGLEEVANFDWVVALLMV